MILIHGDRGNVYRLAPCNSKDDSALDPLQCPFLTRTYGNNSQKIEIFYRNQTPGSRGLLPAPSPLRTGHDSFPSHGSSPSKANLCIEVTRQLKISITFAINTDSQNPFRWRAHGSNNVASFAFPPKIGSASFLATKHPMDVCTLTGRIMSSRGSQSVSTPLQDGLRFFHHLTSYPQQHALRLACP